MTMWRFPSNDHGENKGINDSGVSTFRGTPLKSLAREICQNSLDASNGETVLVDFNLFSISSNDIPGMDALKDSFERCLEFWDIQRAKSTRDFFSNALDVISNDNCNILRISDFNTTGLTGSREELNTDWTNLTKSSGASDKKGTAGGSYGIGKFAPFACSEFSTVFYSTYDVNEEEAYQGVSRIVTFRRNDGETTQGIGYFGNIRNTPVYKQLNLEPDFFRKKGEYGTDIYIVAYKYASSEWQKDIIISVLDSFLGAIWYEKLVIKVGNIKVCKSTLQDLIETYNDDLTGYTGKYYEVLTSESTQWSDEDFMGLGIVKLGILLGDPNAPKRIAIVRKTGMKIMDKDRLPGHIPFAGIMFIEGDKINERLRTIENPEHTDWQPERAKNPLKEKELLKALNAYIKRKLEELFIKGNKDEIDAVGVGSYLPDEDPSAPELAKEEVVSDKVLEIEKTMIRKKTKSGHSTGKSIMEDDKGMNGHKEPEGDDVEWFHPGGTTNKKSSKDGQDASKEIGRASCRERV